MVAVSYIFVLYAFFTESSTSAAVWVYRTSLHNLCVVEYSISFLENFIPSLTHPLSFAQSLDLDALNQAVMNVKARYPALTSFWMEPGRYVVAESGVLLSQVNQIKRKAGVTFVGITAGMHSLIRPALYDSHHEIVNLSREGLRCEEWGNQSGDALFYSHFFYNFSLYSTPACVCGPICESGDVFGRDRQLPVDTQEGDVILIDTVGAYARSMSSQYNLREPGMEIVVTDQGTVVGSGEKN